MTEHRQASRRASARRKARPSAESSTEQSGGATAARGHVPIAGLVHAAEPGVVRRSADGDPLGGTTVPGASVAALRRRRGAGRALPADVAAAAGPVLGADLGNVRIHADGEAATLARSMHARAFTHGADIYFDKGQYAPGTSTGDNVLAHELAHVVSESRSGSGASGGPTIGRADDPAEAAADRLAADVVPAIRRLRTSGR